jgi:hypothetical protein
VPGNDANLLAALGKQQRGGGSDRPGADDDVLSHGLCSSSRLCATSGCGFQIESSAL